MLPTGKYRPLATAVKCGTSISRGVAIARPMWRDPSRNGCLQRYATRPRCTGCSSLPLADQRSESKNEAVRCSSHMT